MQTKQRILVLADPATGSPELIATLSRNGGREPTSFTLLVSAGEDSAGGWSRAISRASRVSAEARQAGVELEETIVADPDPELAIGDALHARDFDRVIRAGEDRDGERVAADAALALAA